MDARTAEQCRAVQAVEFGRGFTLADHVIFEDEYLVAVSKPAGMYVQSGAVLHAGVYDLQTHVATLHPEWKMMHRIDRDTSGLVLFAKTPRSCVALTKIFKSRKLIKEYCCLCELSPEKKLESLTHREDWIDKSIVTGFGRVSPGAFGVFEIGEIGERKGKGQSIVDAETLISLEFIDSEDECAGFRVWPKTGRTHQIRVHMKHLGLPIRGDLRYASGTSFSKAESFPFHFLHAHSLKFQHPFTKVMLNLVAKPPSWWKK